MQCPKWGSFDKVKAGFIRENQRDQCKNCPGQYKRSTPKGQAPHLWEPPEISISLGFLRWRC